MEFQKGHRNTPAIEEKRIKKLKEWWASPQRRNEQSNKHKMMCANGINRPPPYRKYGEDHFAWKGGRRIGRIKNESKRRRLLGFTPLNKPFPNCIAHHIDKEYIIYIPKEIHSKFWHRLNRPETMTPINIIAFHFLHPEETPQYPLWKWD